MIIIYLENVKDISLLFYTLYGTHIHIIYINAYVSYLCGLYFLIYSYADNNEINL